MVSSLFSFKLVKKFWRYVRLWWKYIDACCRCKIIYRKGGKKSISRILSTKLKLIVFLIYIPHEPGSSSFFFWMLIHFLPRGYVLYTISYILCTLPHYLDNFISWYYNILRNVEGTDMTVRVQKSGKWLLYKAHTLPAHFILGRRWFHSFGYLVAPFTFWTYLWATLYAVQLCIYEKDNVWLWDFHTIFIPI